MRTCIIGGVILAGQLLHAGQAPKERVPVVDISKETDRHIIIATTYIKYRPGKNRHSVVSTRFKLAEVDAGAR